MPLQVFLSLTAYACATTFSPGPNNVLLLSSAGQYGFRKCMPLVRGIWTGLLTVMVICGFGCGLIGTWIPQIEKGARIISACYIVWLGYKTLTKPLPSDGENTNQPLTFLNGFLLQFLNVKILMLGVAAYCSFILPLEDSALNISLGPTLMFSCTMAICAACGNLIWLTVGSMLFPIYRKHYRIFNVIMALLLFWCVYKILFV